MLEVVRSIQSLGIAGSVGLPAVAALSLIGALHFLRRQTAFAAIVLINIPLTLIVLRFLSFRIWPRYFFIDIGFILLCTIHGVFVSSQYLARSLRIFKQWRVTGEMLAVTASSIAVVGSLFLLPPNYRYPKQDFVGARDLVERTRAPQDRVASFGVASLAFAKYYAPDWQVVNSWRDIEDMHSPSGSTWLVYTFPTSMAENYPDVLKGLASDFDLLQQFPGTLGDGTVFVYRSRVQPQEGLNPILTAPFRQQTRSSENP